MERRTILVTAAAVTGGFAGCTTLRRLDTRSSDGEGSRSPATSTSPMTATPLVRGTIVFESSRPELTGATVYVRLEDVSLADAPAEVVSEQVIGNPAERASAKGIPFALPGRRTDIDSRNRYSTAVHVDMDGTGGVSAGDYISTEINPVLTFGHSNTVTVSVQSIE